MKPFNFKKKKAEKLFKASTEAENEDQQLTLLLEALELDPEHQLANYQVGFIHKYRGNWALSLKYNKRAYELDKDDEAARWNMAIAATALEEWDVARAAWLACGVKVANEVGPVDGNCGMTPVRLNPDDEAEVVWATRLDPARSQIDNIPFKESGFRFGDIVLNDGAAVGYRTYKDMDYPVFNVLELIQASNYETYTLEVNIQKEDDFDALKKKVFNMGHEIEDWTMSVRMLCKQCSEGTPHENHDHELAKEWQANRSVAIATDNIKEVESILKEWKVNFQDCDLDSQVISRKITKR